MKKVLFLLIIALCLISCKKNGLSPEGPTDIRIQNISDQTFTNVIVKTTDVEGSELNFGSIAPGAYSEYFRFDKAYNKAEITVTINNVVYTTGPVDNTYQAYLGLVKATYVVWITSTVQKKIEIYNVILESDLEL
jgi:hypothetical protein